MTTVECKYGKIAGRELSDGIVGFFGIPYAQAPVGSLRFRAPQRRQAFKGVFEAFEYSKIAPQPPPTPATAIPGDPTEWDEDCLTLNIFCPTSLGSKLPVMVFIHGGGFVSGSSASKLYWGVELAKRGVVLVTINYRLGALGFLSHSNLMDEDSDNACGNWGLMDQVFALRWVKENIEAFYGDPEHICVFGESAGSISIADLATSSRADGCFDAMILESGPAMAMELESAERISQKFAKSLGFENVSRRWLEEIDAKLLVDAQANLISEIGAVGLPFQPVIDGVFLTQHPRKMWFEGAQAQLPAVIGTNKDEMLLFAIGIPNLDKISEEALVKVLEHVPNEISLIKSPVEVFSTYKTKFPEANPLYMWSAIMSDWVFRIPSLKMADSHCRSNKTFVYRFDWETPLLGGMLKACHALELPFVFGSFQDQFVSLFAGGQKAGASELSNTIQECWTRFAKNHDVNADSQIIWEPYESRRRPTYLLNSNSELVYLGDDELIRIWYE